LFAPFYINWVLIFLSYSQLEGYAKPTTRANGRAYRDRLSSPIVAIKDTTMVGNEGGASKDLPLFD
jgi:hypothetical protein